MKFRERSLSRLLVKREKEEEREEEEEEQQQQQQKQQKQKQQQRKTARYVPCNEMRKRLIF